MKKFFVPLALCWAAVSCAPGEPAKVTDSPSETTAGPPKTRPRQICFPGSGNAKSCWDLIFRASLPEQKNLYGYPDPYTDPSFPGSFSKAQYIPPDRLLDLRRLPGRTRLAENFERLELMPDGGTRGFYGVFSPAALRRIQTMRSQTGRALTVTSGYRSPGYNSRLDGSARWSRHTYGDAIDFRISGLGLKAAAEKCREVGASFTQLYTSHVHCDWRNLPLDGAAFPAAPQEEFPPAALETKVNPAGLGRIVPRLEAAAAESPTLVLSTEVLQEDEGELLHEWEVLTPSGELLTGESRDFPIPRVPGTYRIRVTVGGSLNFERHLTIP
jgi:hypothetical protein